MKENRKYRLQIVRLNCFCAWQQNTHKCVDFRWTRNQMKWQTRAAHIPAFKINIVVNKRERMPLANDEKIGSVVAWLQWKHKHTSFGCVWNISQAVFLLDKRTGRRTLFYSQRKIYEIVFRQNTIYSSHFQVNTMHWKQIYALRVHIFGRNLYLSVEKVVKIFVRRQWVCVGRDHNHQPFRFARFMDFSQRFSRFICDPSKLLCAYSSSGWFLCTLFFSRPIMATVALIRIKVSFKMISIFLSRAK